MAKIKPSSSEKRWHGVKWSPVKKFLTPLRVGLLVLAAGIILFGALNFVSKGGLEGADAIHLHAFFHDASGLGKRSFLQTAGITVGEIVSITLEEAHAKVEMKLRSDIKVRANATLTKRSESFLGDYLLDLTLGTEDAPLLKDGDEIKNVIEAPSMSQILNSVATITEDVQAITRALRASLGGITGQESVSAIVENVVKLTETLEEMVRDNTQHLNRILLNADVVSNDIRQILASERASIQHIVKNIDVISNDVRDVVAAVKQMMGDDDPGPLRETVERLDRSLENVEQITQDIKQITQDVKQGKGTVGALLQDERLQQKMTETMEDVADFTGRLASLQLETSVKVDYLTQQSAAKTFFGVRLISKPDKYYLLEVVDDPRGTISTSYVQANPPAVGEPVLQKQIVTRDGFKFSAQFAKRYSFFTLRFGIIESTGGVGADINIPIKFPYYSYWLEDAVSLKVDAFNFSVEALRFPRVRATLRFTPYEHIYVNVGVDDVLNNTNREALTNRLISGRDFFFGAGIYFTDADLKSLLPIIPTP